MNFLMNIHEYFEIIMNYLKVTDFLRIRYLPFLSFFYYFENLVPRTFLEQSNPESNNPECKNPNFFGISGHLSRSQDLVS